MNTIDVHARYIPRSYLDALKKKGVGETEIGFPMELWDADKRIALMDRGGVQSSIISLSSPSIRYFSGAEAVELCRRLNDELAELVARHPSRFGSFMALPLPDADATLSELERCRTELDADGFCAMTNYGGVFIGDPQFAPVQEELDRQRAVLFVHPTENAGNETLSQGFLAPAFEYPAESTRAVVSLLKHGVIGRHTGIKFIICHGGGTLPFVGSRLSRLLPLMEEGSAEEKSTKATKYEELMATLYFDLALVQYRPSLEAIAAFHPTHRLLMGFDQPFNAFTDIAEATDQILGFAGFADALAWIMHQS
jgi:6-methylsalicylate decarboxylase